MLDAALTVISPVNHEADSVEQVKIIAETLAGRCRYVVVKNQAHSDQFKIYDNSRTRARVIEEIERPRDHHAQALRLARHGPERDESLRSPKPLGTRIFLS